MTLSEKYPECFEILRNLFGDDIVDQRWNRLCEIYNTCERKWQENLNRLNKVKYLLIAEAAPWSENGTVNYFYNTFNGSWCSRIWKAFYDDPPPNDVDRALILLAEKQFLLIDSLPFAMKYNTNQRNNPLYNELIICCKDLFLKKLNIKKIKWGKKVKIALAFKKNGQSIINAFPDGIQLPNGQKIKLGPCHIATDRSNYTNSKKLRSIFRLNQSGNSINYPGLEWNKVATKVMDLLMERGVPYQEGIKGLIQDLEFHYQTDHGKILSSLEQANLYIDTDVRIHSDNFNLSFKSGKLIFCLWAAHFHPEDHIKLLSEKISLEINDENTEINIPVKAEKKQPELKRRNPFVALCELASEENWCWNIYCTTCGCMYFRYSLAELVKGKHPDDNKWIIRELNHRILGRSLGPLPMNLSLESQQVLLQIVSLSDVMEIQRIASFPDWLGYIGFVLRFCSNAEHNNRKLTESFIPQFLELMDPASAESARLREIYSNKSLCLNWRDLELVEHGIQSGRHAT